MTLADIKEKILESIPGSEVHVLDPMNDGQHLQAIVISDEFIDKSLIQQHQMVMRPLREALAGEVHALGLKTYTVEKWKEAQKSPDK